jgi:hypothetical protein
MKQNVADIPIHTFQRKAAIATGSVQDHAGCVTVSKIPNFNLNKTIFNTLEGRIPRFVMQTRIAKDVAWRNDEKHIIDQSYTTISEVSDLPLIDPALLKFMVEECDFDVEHADGSFLDHLYFCYEYTHHHLPDHSALVMLLHSILGTGTNTFAMEASKIPALKSLVDVDEWLHIESFPSVLRLLYEGQLTRELYQNVNRLEQLQSIIFHRVIDNQLISMSASQFWVQLNYQLIHLVDFLPVSNWQTHSNDTSFILFRTLYEFLSSSDLLEAKIDYIKSKNNRVIGEEQDWGAKLISMIPVSLSARMASKSIQKFSTRIGHSLDFELHW